MKLGVILLGLGAALLTYGIFGIDRGAVSRPSYVIGLILMTAALMRLAWVGWNGNLAATVLAGLASAILTWTVYEMVRQSPSLPAIGVLGEMTAPLLSATVAAVVIVAGLIRANGMGAGTEAARSAGIPSDPAA
jgi:hypothetical protein